MKEVTTMLSEAENQKMSKLKKEFTLYLAELAITNPEKVPAAMAEVIQCQVMLMMVNFFKRALEDYTTTLEKQMNESWDRLKGSGGGITA